MPESCSLRARIGTTALLVSSACAAPAPPRAAVPSAPAAAAPDAPQRVSVRYEATPECPDFGVYAEHVAQRSSRLVPVAELDAGSEANVEVALEQTASGFLGRVLVREPAATQREVTGERCVDVVAALALITVMRLETPEREAAVETATSPAPGTGATDETSADSAPELAPAAPPVTAATAEPSASKEPSASTDPSATDAPSPQEEAPQQPAESTAETSLPPVNTTTPAEATSTATSEIEEAPPLADPNELTITRPHVETEVEADTLDDTDDPPLISRPAFAAYAGYASVPGHALKLMLEAELGLGSPTSSWAIGLAAAYTRGETDNAVGRAALELFSLQLALCPPGGTVGPRLELRACGALRGGLLDLSASAAERPIEAIDTLRPWLAVGANLRLEWALGERWSVFALGEFAAQLVRDRFEVQRPIPNSAESQRVTLYRPEPISIELSLGAGYSF